MDYLTFYRKTFLLANAADHLVHTEHRDHEAVRQGARNLRKALRELEVEIERDALRSWQK